MVVKPETVVERLKSLDTVLQELSKYQSISGMRIFPQFAQEILAWLDALDPQP